MAADPERLDVGSLTHGLYTRYGAQILAYCLHHLGSREEAEDAVQTTFLNAFRALQRGTTTHAEQAWLYQIARNVCLARGSASGRRLRREAPDDFEVLQEIVPAPRHESAEELIGLEDVLEAMPENQRRAILMREWQGLSYREIGAQLGLSQASVEMLIFRARRSLAKGLEQPPSQQRTSRLLRRAGAESFELGGVVAALKSLFTGGMLVKAAVFAAAAGTFSGALGDAARHTFTGSLGQPAQYTIVRPSAHAPRVRPCPPAAGSCLRAPARRS